MTWTYRVCHDRQGRYSIREVFYNRNNVIINDSKIPVAVAILRRFWEIVGWVERQLDPTNADKCWVRFLNPTYVFSYF
ncbi:hypothetical protein [Scytonema sp. UIC 10036]|uniref:hypothetical protein n=1 Tax=Scytonema sp. UIC 10036 TaxID=2304196 RepID=UPI00140F75EB|nr:hypothetical protein [Scytonema sp. UIC 10036]